MGRFQIAVAIAPRHPLARQRESQEGLEAGRKLVKITLLHEVNAQSLGFELEHGPVLVVRRVECPRQRHRGSLEALGHCCPVVAAEAVGDFDRGLRHGERQARFIGEG